MLLGHQRITWHRNIAENFNRLSRVHERYRQIDDRQTDKTTDGRTTTYSEHEHEFTFAKNLSLHLYGLVRSSISCCCRLVAVIYVYSRQVHFSPHRTALQADYVTVVEDRPSYNVRRVLYPRSSLPLLAKTNPPCSAVSLR